MIIKSLLEDDLYKLNMQQVIFHQFPTYQNEWDFKCRNKGVKFTAKDLEDINRELDEYCKLSFTEEELTWLKKNILWFKPDYIDLLRLWRPNRNEIIVSDKSECSLKITLKGTWLNVTMYEMPILAIVNETYFRNHYNYDELFEQFKRKAEEKIYLIKDGTYHFGAFSEFGLRRRLSFEAQDYIVRRLAEEKAAGSIDGFVGTSNVYLAKKYNLRPIGTVAHEFVINVGQGNPKHNPAYSNWYGMDSWVKEYGVLNGTWLTDTIGDECCLRDMGLTFSTLFSGVRHDSGDPFVWGDNWIKHWESLGIDPHTKTLLFSDSLNFDKAQKIADYFKGKAKVAFGIGTYLSNDTDVEPLNIVCKVANVNGRDVAKISNDKGKTMCRDPEYVKYLDRTISWRLEHETV